MSHAPKILVTGAYGSIGRVLCQHFDAVQTDIHNLNVRDRDQVSDWFTHAKPNLVFHLAGAKHAPEGEVDPAQIAETNIEGTRNVLKAAGPFTRVVVASTCKAANPETVYGASKLIAERMALNAGQTVARFYNVIETSGNVFTIWDNIPEPEPLPVCPARRYWISLEQAVDLLVRCATFPSGRYAVDPGPPVWAVDMAAQQYPGRLLQAIPLRRGDRQHEPLYAHNEHVTVHEPGIFRITSSHDSPDSGDRGTTGEPRGDLEALPALPARVLLA
jgi:FlaA1/EpsC-like NDP-sugar epimerase